MQTIKLFMRILDAHKWGMVIILALFAGMTFMMTEFGDDPADTFAPTSRNVTVINRDGGALSDALTEFLGEHHNLVTVYDDYYEMLDALFFHITTYIIIIDEGFEAAFLRDASTASIEFMEAPNVSGTIFIEHQINGFFTLINAYLAADIPLNAAITRALNAADANITLLPTYRPGSSRYFYILPFAIVSVMVMAISTVLIVYKKDDLIRRMNVSSTPATARNMQMLFGCIICALVFWLLFMAGAHLLHPEPLTSHNGSLRALNSLVFSVTSVGIAFLLGQVLKKTTTLAAVAQLIGLGLGFTSGAFVPQEILADGVLAAARFMPMYWYVRSNEMLSDTIYNANIFWQGIGIQMAFAVAFIAVALVLGRERQVAAG